MPERYAWHEMREERVRTNTGKDWSVLTDRRGDGKKKTLTLRQFRERIESGETFDRHDWGGCGCALDDQSLVNIAGLPRAGNAATPTPSTQSNP